MNNWSFIDTADGRRGTPPPPNPARNISVICIQPSRTNRHVSSIAWQARGQEAGKVAAGEGGTAPVNMLCLQCYEHTSFRPLGLKFEFARIYALMQASYGDWREQERAERKWSQKLSAS